MCALSVHALSAITVCVCTEYTESIRFVVRVHSTVHCLCTNVHYALNAHTYRTQSHSALSHTSHSAHSVQPQCTQQHWEGRREGVQYARKEREAP